MKFLKHGRALFAVRGHLDSGSDLTLGLFGLGFFALAWCILTYGGYIRPLFLPTPEMIWEGALDFHRQGWLVPAIWSSFWRVTKSLFLVCAVGIPLGVLMGTFAPIDAFFRRLIDGAKSVPTTGIAGLIVLWFSIEERAKIVFLFIGAIFYMIILVKNAVMNVSDDFLTVAFDLGASRADAIRRVILPAALPQIWEAVAVCNGIMWTYIVLAEFINSNQEQLGVGFLLNIGSRTQDSGKVFASLIIIALVSSTTDWALSAIHRRRFSW